VFRGFLALVLRKELDRCLDAAGHRFEWADLNALQTVTIEENNKHHQYEHNVKASGVKHFKP
jgi:hypothetical protein